MRGDIGVSGIDRQIATLAERQHGVVARRQLLALGVGMRAIEHRIECGRLHRLHRGVYAVGHKVLRREGRWIAATLASRGAVLSHRSAAALWTIRPHEGADEVTVTRERRQPPNVRLRVSRLADDERTVRDGIPVTTAARTLLDLAGVLDRPRLEIAVNRAEAMRLTDVTSLATLAERHAGRRGIANLRAVLGRRPDDSRITRSELENRFYALIACADLPSPGLNVPISTGRGWVEADVVWIRERLIVELDGRAFHDNARSFESDRARDRALTLDGWRVVRVTWSQLRDEPSTLLADLRTMLRRSNPTFPPR